MPMLCHDHHCLPLKMSLMKRQEGCWQPCSPQRKPLIYRPASKEIKNSPSSSGTLRQFSHQMRGRRNHRVALSDPRCRKTKNTCLPKSIFMLKSNCSCTVFNYTNSIFVQLTGNRISTVLLNVVKDNVFKDAFLSGLFKVVQKLLGFHELNTTAYHPQTDGLVERFNRTLTSMLVKTVEKGGRDWALQLPYVLFAYWATQQQSTLESPFFLLYGRDPRLPTESVMFPGEVRNMVDLKEYGVELASRMSEAWELARECIGKAQKR